MGVEIDFERIGTYTRRINNTAVIDALPNRLNEDPKLYGKLEEGLDLKRGCEGFKDEGYGDLFYSLFDYIKKTSNRGERLTEVINADFISNRRNLILLASSSYDYRIREEIRALRKNGIIFLCNRKSENEQPNKYPDGSGYKFEQYMTLREDETPNDGNERVSNAECNKSVLRTTFKTENEEIKVFYAAEMDAMDKDGKYVEMKKTSLNHEEWLNKFSLRHYLQSYLGNVSFIVKGHSNNKIVHQVDKIETESIPGMNVKWDPEICKLKLFKELQTIKKMLREDDTAVRISIFRGEVKYFEENPRNCQFVDQQFLNYFS